MKFQVCFASLVLDCSRRRTSLCNPELQQWEKHSVCGFGLTVSSCLTASPIPCFISIMKDHLKSKSIPYGQVFLLLRTMSIISMILQCASTMGYRCYQGTTLNFRPFSSHEPGDRDVLGQKSAFLLFSCISLGMKRKRYF